MRQVISNFRRMANNADRRATEWEAVAKNLKHINKASAINYARLARSMRRDAKNYRQWAEELSP